MPLEVPVLTVADASAWAKWLSGSATTSRGVWLTLAKKNVTQPTSLTYEQALDEALCYGWIDGQRRKGDEKTFGQRFTPRTATSIWSQRNVGYITRLENEGRMTELGRKAVEAAKADGRWDAAYGGPANAAPPPEFLAAVAAIPKAQATWDNLSKQNRFAIYFRLSSLKTAAGKEKRMAAYVEMLARGETIHPQKEPGKVVSKNPTPATTPKAVPTSKRARESSKTTTAARKQNAATPLETRGAARRSARLSRANDTPE